MESRRFFVKIKWKPPTSINININMIGMNGMNGMQITYYELLLIIRIWLANKQNWEKYQTFL